MGSTYLEGITHADTARHRLEQTVLEHFRACFSRPDIAPDDNFFVLGGDSGMATRLLARLHEACGAEIPPDAIFTSPTPRELADAIQALAQPTAPGGGSSLVPLNHGHRGTPLYLFHATSGSPWVYRALVEQAGLQRPVLALRAPDLDWDQDVLSMEGMTQHYAAEIRRVQRRGPYSLAGFSFGGNLAFEVANRLVADGQQVEHLVMIDTIGPRTLRDRLAAREIRMAPLWRRLCRMGTRGRALLDAIGYTSPMGRIFLCFGTGPLTKKEVERILAVTFPEQAKSVDVDRLSLAELCDVVVGMFAPTLSSAAWEHLSRRDPGEDALVLVKAQKVWAKNYWFSLAHRPRDRYPGTIVIFASRENREVLRWRRYTDRSLDVRWVDIPERLHTRFIDPENLPMFVQDFKALLEPGDASPAAPPRAAGRERALRV